MTARALRLGTRGSRLALWQAQTVTNRLQAAGARVEIIVIKTSGDRLQSRPLSESGTKRLFVKEIEDALLSGDIDLAVHSAKDMPATLPDGLEVAAALPERIRVMPSFCQPRAMRVARASWQRRWRSWENIHRSARAA